jgi:hypothetical protein
MPNITLSFLNKQIHLYRQKRINLILITLTKEFGSKIQRFHAPNTKAGRRAQP